MPAGLLTDPEGSRPSQPSAVDGPSYGGAVSSGSGSYSEGERVFGPPGGSYDADWVASAARQQDAGLDPGVAAALSGEAWEQIRGLGELDAPAVARALLARHPDLDASACTVVARAAVDFCESYGVTP